MAIRITCPNCGSRPYTEFWFGGEVPPPPGEDDGPHRSFERVWIRANRAGAQRESWFHYAGCRRWLEVTRDTRTNEFDAGA